METKYWTIMKKKSLSERISQGYTSIFCFRKLSTCFPKGDQKETNGVNTDFSIQCPYKRQESISTCAEFHRLVL